MANRTLHHSFRRLLPHYRGSSRSAPADRQTTVGIHDLSRFFARNAITIRIAATFSRRSHAMTPFGRLHWPMNREDAIIDRVLKDMVACKPQSFLWHALDQATTSP